ncbi:hypothetical protein Clacol_003594 [Clathrus columnatus]|uniref:RNA polymerase II transcription factor B subunit 2 n=1 Tax=Clathrus columnatus TaxID=1419009 RepID=A0AAV5A786_9AGAM|nr:hypothetical protein Clacol_003594 [Clathrus columnatus]
MSMLWLDSALPTATFEAWITLDGRKFYEEALKSLSKLHILSTTGSKLTLNTTFRTAFRMALTGDGEHRSFGIPADKWEKDKDKEKEKRSTSIESLDNYAREHWETILHFMVSSGTGQAPAKPSQGVLYLLQRSGLMATLLSTSGTSMRITSAGFQFLLHSPHEQLWMLLLQYLHMAEERQMDVVEILSFLLMLSTMELGQAYLTENLSPTQLTMLEDLQDYGMIKQKKQKSTHTPNQSSIRRFFPTRLSTTLTSSSSPLPTVPGTLNGLGGTLTKGPIGTTGTTSEGFIILETNYRLYAYTDNPLQIAVLNLFVSLKSRFPNLVVGSLSRDSVKKALSNGITADQNPLLPVTVQDQVRLWELERNRLKSQEGYLYTSFASQSDYEFVLDYARKLGVVIWESATKRCFFGTLEGHGLVRAFIESRTAGRG